MNRTAFFITPLGAESSVTRDRADWVHSVLLEPELASSGYRLVRAAKTPFVRPIRDEIARYLYSADLVIADVTDANPNVMYELGRRHAWGEHCLIIADQGYQLAELPFDISAYPVVLRYEQTNNATAIERFRATFGSHLVEVQRERPRIVLPSATEEEKRRLAHKLARTAGLSVLLGRYDGREDHYKVAQRLMSRPIKNLFLMQRSSTLVLGAEQGWRWERRFYEIVLSMLADGTNLFHLVSLEGITRHLRRRTSHFPEVDTLEDRLSHLHTERDDIVAIEGTAGPMRFKKLPPESEESLKPDRQARTLIADFGDGDVEGLIVADLGEAQSAFWLAGSEMEEWFDDCVNYFHRCEYLYWGELKSAVEGGSTSAG